MIRIVVGLVLLLVSSSFTFAQVTMTSAARHVQQGNAYLLRNQFASAVRSYSIALGLKELSRDKRAAILNDRGVARWRLKDYDKAISDFTSALDNKTNYPQAVNNRGNVYLEMGNIEEAINDFTKASLLAPDYGVSYINRGNAYYLSKNYHLAKADYETAMRLLPTQAIAYHGAGLSNIALERQYAALRNLNRALILNKSYKSALLNRANVYTALDFEGKALEDLSLSIRNDPENHKLLIRRARLRIKLKQYYPAINDAQKALKLAPGFVDAFIVRGMAYNKIKKTKAALKDFNTAIEDNPDRTETYIRRAQLYQRRAELEKAQIDLKTALELEKSNALIHKLLGEIAEANKETDQALAFYQQALKLDPLLEGARENIKNLTGVLPPINGKQIGQALNNWIILDITKRNEEAKDANLKVVPGRKINAPIKHRYILANADYPHFSAPLEMHGKGVPRLLDWTALKKPLHGFGLLRYFAGYQDEEAQSAIENIAIINLRDNSIIAVEPYKWGKRTAKWSWRQVSVVVTDPDNISSEVFLKKARARAQVAAQRSNYNSRRRGFVSSQRYKARPKKRRKTRSRRRRKNKGMFDWLF